MQVLWNGLSYTLSNVYCITNITGIPWVQLQMIIQRLFCSNFNIIILKERLPLPPPDDISRVDERRLWIGNVDTRITEYVQ